MNAKSPKLNKDGHFAKVLKKTTWRHQKAVCGRRNQDSDGEAIGRNGFLRGGHINNFNRVMDEQ